MDVVAYVLSKRYTDSRIAGIDVGGGKLDYLVVDELPETGQDNTVYLVPTETAGQYDEYIWKDQVFKKLTTQTISDIVEEGYYYGNVFWKDAGHSTRLPDRIDCIYLDLDSKMLYYYNTTTQNYKQFLSISIATESQPGIMKLYRGVGKALDGTITQKAITDHLKKKVELNTDELSEECLGFTLNKA